MEESKKTLLTKIQNLYNDLESILKIAPTEDECNIEEKDMYADMQNLLESILIANYDDGGLRVEFSEKNKEYQDYIDEHINFVKAAAIGYGEKLCKALGITWLELSKAIKLHDKSKYSVEEFEGYRQWFYPCSYETKNKDLFDKAWEHHYTHNKHHPEYWKGEDMTPLAIAEMLLDWEAMSMKFNTNTYEYYQKERDNKELSENTKKIIDQVIHIFLFENLDKSNKNNNY